MSQPGPLSENFSFYNKQYISYLRDHGSKGVAGKYQYHTFWANRMNYFKPFLTEKISQVNENGTIPSYSIKDLPESISSIKERDPSGDFDGCQTIKRSSARRVIIYGLLKRLQKNCRKDLFKIRNRHPNIEDVIPGNYMPGFDALEREVDIDPAKYEFDDENDLIFLEDHMFNQREVTDILVDGKDLRENMSKVNTGRPVVLIGRFKGQYEQT